MQSKFSVFSFFSGCGILDLGFEKSNFNIVFVDEFSKAFLQGYQYSRKCMGINAPKYGYSSDDVNIFLADKKDFLLSSMKKERDSGNLVGFIGGPPCPDFSVGGKNKGRNGDHGKLSLSYVNLICSASPDFFLFENVKGLWRTARHREFYDELKSKLESSGYELVDRLTNSLEFAVPQDRDRILLIGIKRDLLASDNIHDFPWLKYAKYDINEVKSMPWPTVSDFTEDSETECPANLPQELTCEYWFRKNDVTNHPNSNRFFTPKAGLERMQTIQEGDSYKKSYKRVHRWRYSPTVAYGNNEVHLHPYHARRLSVSEAMSLQSLPKEFCLPNDMTLSNSFKTIGNGVPFLLAKGIAGALYDYLTTNVIREEQ